MFLSTCTPKDKSVLEPEDLEGTNENIKEYLNTYLSDPRFSDTHIKKSFGDGKSFPKLSVKVRKEIVSLHLDSDINPNEITGKRLKPDERKI